MSKPNNFTNLIISTHSIVQDRLSTLRDESSSHSNFRKLLEDISLLLFCEASADLELQKSNVKTPLEVTEAAHLKKKILLVPILRAGLGMLDGIHKILPDARIGMLGVYRNEETLQPVDYYKNFPKDLHHYDIFVLDPMLATGGSAKYAFDTLKDHGAEDFCMISVISAPEGVKLLQKTHPKIKIYTAALDRQLNDKAFILPGLGDAGDRYFGT
jgi:uracil phosphoribosyltransferase